MKKAKKKVMGRPPTGNAKEAITIRLLPDQLIVLVMAHGGARAGIEEAVRRYCKKLTEGGVV